MRVLNNTDYKLFERLVSLNQKEIMKAMEKYLKRKYEKCIITNKYLVALGDIPIALVAHMDTVFKTPVSHLYYDEKKGVLWSPEGLGADDRAGIFAIIKILQKGLRPSIILTTDEEKGGIGAEALARLNPCPISNLKYMIELDRQGKDDCVFYSCYCPEFVDYVESFGFHEQWGSFSDISFLMPKWKICGVNLSVGYKNEHSYSECLFINNLLDTITKVEKMLKDKNIPNFDYDEVTFVANSWWKESDTVYGQHCSKCKKLYSEYELFPVTNSDNKILFYCPDCMVGNVGWCNICQEPFIIEGNHSGSVCEECMRQNV